ncbi:hypothetical protein FH972_024696 [Carpinus fangiana]|uniref:Enoyl reductase (ER) domain-containing protein n=1 Tax=Carpinus fangiana TaxID=176857 RepID=A0A5N6L198_9ROSI|nr:hypothetical protein FH972_024696 [Carpinus fangiana]
MNMQNFGLIRIGTGRASLQSIPIPRVPAGHLLVRTVAVALNPTDWTTLDARGDNGTLVGCDYAGIVEEVGEAVTKTFKPGDRVAGFGHGGNDANPETGAFARLIVVKGDIQMRIPDNISFEAACSVGVGVMTTGYGLYNILDLPPPVSSQQCEDHQQILIYGGSTATGSIAIQFAKLSGWKVVTVCSPKYFDFVKDLGADAAFDYRSPHVGKQIYDETEGKISMVFDTVALESTAAICAAAIGPRGGHYCNLLGAECPRTDVKSTFFLGYDMSGESYKFEGDTYEANHEAFLFGTKFAEAAETLWAKGAWRPHPQRIETGGLLGVSGGLQEMREGKVSGVKLVYLVDETKWT